MNGNCEGWPLGTATGRVASHFMPGSNAAGAWRLAGSICAGMMELCFPPTCVFCHGAMDSQVIVPQLDLPRNQLQEGSCSRESVELARSVANGLCKECRDLIHKTAIHHGCLRCGQVLPPSDCLAMLQCRECDRQPSSISRVVVLGAYQQILREAVVASKRIGYLPLVANLGDLLGLKIRESFDGLTIGAVTYIPSHWSRRLRRGGVPAQELARRVAKLVGSPVVPLLKCVRTTKKQGTLSDKERRMNVRGAFIARKGYALREKRILVVDDVWTTGSTLREAARALSQGFDAEILAAVVARAVGTHSG